jgi:cytochrome c5
MKVIAASIAAWVFCISSAARAAESDLHLKQAPEATLVRANCSTCHSVDYIQMNAPFMKRAAWETEVRKMIKVMGAPVSDESATRIVDYLVQYYGLE